MNKAMRTSVSRPVVMALALAMVSTAGIGAARSAHASSTISVTIGAPAPLTGAEASFGEDMIRGAQLAASQARGIHVKILPEDTACDPQTSVNAANKLVTAKVTAVVGYYCSGAALPAETIYHRQNLALIVTAALNPAITRQGFPQVFRSIGSTQSEAKTAARFIGRKLHVKTVALIHDNSAYGKGLAVETEHDLKAYHVKTVLITAVTPGAKDFGATVSAINAAHPDLTYFTAYYPEGALLLKQLASSGYKGKLMGGSGNQDPKFIAIAGEKLSERIVFTSPPLTDQLPSAKRFIRSYKKKFNRDPGGYSVYEYDGVNAMITAIKKAGSTHTDKIIAQLRKLNFAGVTGHIKFAKDGQNVYPNYTELTVRKGKFVLLSKAGKS